MSEKVLEFASGCSMLDASLSVGEPGNSRRATGPHLKGFSPANANHTQFEREAHCGRATVASQHCVTPGKTNGLLEYADRKGWRNPRNGRHVAAINAYVEVIENKPYLATRRETNPL